MVGTKIEKDYIIVDHELKFYQLNKHIEDHKYFAFDTETTGLNVRKDKVIGFSISGKIGTAFYVPLFSWNSSTEQLDQLMDLDKFKDLIIKLAGKDLLMWNASFDVRIVKNNLGIDLTEALLADVMLMKHTIQEDGDFGLKKVAVQYQAELGLDMETAANEEQIELKANVAKNGGETTKANYEMFKADLPIMGKYACADADLTLRLSFLFREKLEAEGLEDYFYDHEVMPLYKEVTIKMEEKGLVLDLDLINKTRDELMIDAEKIRAVIVEQLMDTSAGKSWYTKTLNDNYPPKKTGKFGQELVEMYKLPLPLTPSGKYQMGKKILEKLEDTPEKLFLLTTDPAYLDKSVIREIQETIHIKDKGVKININSKTQMKQLVFDTMKVKPLSRTDKGAPQFNDDMISKLEDLGYLWAATLSVYNKLIKIKGTYMDRFLDAEEDGLFYPSFKQHGTVSGRYGSDMQQLPRPKEKGELPPVVLRYNNLIRKFFITGEDRIFIDSDYESLEPHVFAHVSGDEGLRDIFRKGHDFYSTIAIRTEKLLDLSPDKLAENYLGKVNKPLRQKAKAYCLGVPYGMKGFALGKTLGVPQKEADKLIDGYLNGFPELKKWMKHSEYLAKTQGWVKTETGRIRHLPEVKRLFEIHGDKLMDFKYRAKLGRKYGKDEVKKMYGDYKNGLNNAKNVQIQGLSASIVNRAAIGINRELIKRGVNGWVCLQIHDQLVVDVPRSRTEECRQLVQEIMESVYPISIKLKSPAEVATNLAEGH